MEPKSSSTLSNFPDELISRIFTIGSDDSDAREYFAPDSVYRHNLGPIVESVLSPFASKVSMICRRWYALTRSRGNAHLWKRIAELHIGDIFFGELVHTFTAFRFAVSDSKGHDLYIRFHLGFYSRLANVTDLKFFLLGIFSLRKYLKQLAFISVVASPEDEGLARWIQKIVCGFGDSPRLWGISLTKTFSHYDPHSTSSVHAYLPDASLYGLLNGDDDRLWEYENIFPHISYMELSIGLFNGGSRSRCPYGPQLTKLKLKNWTSEASPCFWPFFQNLLDRCTLLKVLECDLQHTKDLPPFAASESGLTRSVSKLESLALYADPFTTLVFLHTAWFKTLTNMELHIRDSLTAEQSEEFEAIALDEITVPLPALAKLAYSSTSVRGNILVATILHPSLEELRICKPLTALGTNLDEQPSQDIDLTAWPSPKELTIEYWDSVTEVFSILLKVNLDAVERTSFTTPDPALQPIPEPETSRDRYLPADIRGRRIPVPKLTFLQLKSLTYVFPLTGSRVIMENISAPRLRMASFWRREAEALTLQFSPTDEDGLENPSDTPPIHSLAIASYSLLGIPKLWPSVSAREVEILLTPENIDHHIGLYGIPGIELLSQVVERDGTRRLSCLPLVEAIRLRCTSDELTNRPEILAELQRVVAVRIEHGAPLKTVEILHEDEVVELYARQEDGSQSLEYRTFRV